MNAVEEDKEHISTCIKKKMEQNNAVDVMKFICALLIIAIHQNPFEDIGGVLEFYFVNVLARVAVPFFYASSGYFLFLKMEYRNGKLVNSEGNRDRLCNYLKRLTLLYVLWSLIYLTWRIPYWNSIGWTGVNAVKDYIVSFFNTGSHYHFWYFVCLIYATPMLYFMLCVFSQKTVTIFAVGCYFLKCLVYAYDWLPLSMIEVAGKYYNYFSGITDAVCLAMPLMVMGVLQTKKHANLKGKNQNSFYLVGMVISTILLIGEATWLKYFTPNKGTYSYILMTLPVCYFIFHMILEMKIKGNSHIFKWLRNASVIIYCVHPLLIELLKCCSFFENADSLVKYFVIVAMSMLTAFILQKGNCYIKCLHVLY